MQHNRRSFPIYLVYQMTSRRSDEKLCIKINTPRVVHVYTCTYLATLCSDGHTRNNVANIMAKL